VSLKVASQLSTMKQGFASPQGLADLVAKEQAAQVALGNLTPSVPTIHYPFYLNFCRELWSAGKKGICGTGLSDTAGLLKIKYLGYGLAAPGLIAIAALFSITLT
jgi:hypothetical protein